MATIETSEYLTLRDVARHTGMSLNGVRVWVRRGALPTTQLVPKGKHLVPRHDLERLLAPREREP